VLLKQNINEDIALELEKMLIAWYGRKDLGTGILNNLTDGGDGIRNPSQETRRLMAEAKRNESEEVRKKRSDSAKARRGRTCSEETKIKIGLANTGRKRTNEAKEKMSKAKVGKPLSVNHCQKISVSLKGRPGRPASAETRKKIGDAFRGKPWTEARRAALKAKEN